MDIFLNRK